MLDSVLIHPSYGNSIAQYATIAQAKEVTFEVCDNYQKQTYRNRLKIATSTGVLQLSIPIIHNSQSKGRQRTYDVKIENKFHWQRDHWRSIKVAYQTSPYFEFYEDAFEPIYHRNYRLLSEFNTSLQSILLESLELDIEVNETSAYQSHYDHKIDLRNLVLAKKEPAIVFPKYHQLFHDKHGFISNLSILDLLFNEGPNAITYLESIDLTPLL